MVGGVTPVAGALTGGGAGPLDTVEEVSVPVGVPQGPGVDSSGELAHPNANNRGVRRPMKRGGCRVLARSMIDDFPRVCESSAAAAIRAMGIWHETRQKMLSLGFRPAVGTLLV